MRTLLIFLLLAPLAWADVESVRPACGLEGDYVVLAGTNFADEPAVTFDGVAAEVLRGRADRLLVMVPAGLTPGAATIDVDGSTVDFTVLAPGAPVVHHLSAATAFEGAMVYVVGDRLTDGRVAFVDDGGAVADTAPLEGRRYIAFFEVPAGLPVGDYTLRFVNGDGLDTDPCSPALAIVEKGPPAVDAITPADQQPGYFVTIEGTNLAPWGEVTVTWTDNGNVLETSGFSNGTDRVFTWVPNNAEGGVTYDVTLTFRDGATSPAVAYTVGVPPPPTIDRLEYDTGPAGSTLGIFGAGFGAGNGFFPLGGRFSGDSGNLDVTVEFTQGGTATEAEVLFVFPGFGLFDDAIFARVPDLADGDYEVTVTVGDVTSNAVTFTVATLPLTVSGMTPDSHRDGAFPQPVLIEGTGFGVFDIFSAQPNVTVTWDDGVDPPREGFVLYHDDREIVVLPPIEKLNNVGDEPILFIGGRVDGGPTVEGLPPGEYTVRVDNGDETVVAGTYTVE